MPLSLFVLAAPFACAESPRPPLDPEDAGPTIQADSAAPSDVDGSVPERDAGRVTCSVGGFCETTLPVRRPLVAVSGSSPDDIWAAGGDVIERWDGTSWKVMYQYREPRSSFFESIWAKASDDVWAMGDKLIVHYSAQAGEQPSFHEYPIPLGPSASTFASAQRGNWLAPTSDEIWAVRNTGVVYRFREDPNGVMASETWIPKADPGDTENYSWRSVWGFAPDDVYVGGVRGKLPNGVGIPSSLAAIAHYDGSDWSIVTFTGYPTGFRGIFGIDDVALHKRELWGGTYPSAVPNEPAQGSVLRIGVGEDGTLHEPQVVEMPEVGICTYSNDSASFLSSSDGWFSSGCIVYRLNNSKVELVPLSFTQAPLGNVTGIWASSPDDVWVVGKSVPQDSDYFPAAGFALHRTKKFAEAMGQR